MKKIFVILFLSTLPLAVRAIHIEKVFNNSDEDAIIATYKRLGKMVNSSGEEPKLTESFIMLENISKGSAYIIPRQAYFYQQGHSLDIDMPQDKEFLRIATKKGITTLHKMNMKSLTIEKSGEVKADYEK